MPRTHQRHLSNHQTQTISSSSLPSIIRTLEELILAQLHAFSFSKLPHMLPRTEVVAFQMKIFFDGEGLRLHQIKYLSALTTHHFHVSYANP